MHTHKERCSKCLTIYEIKPKSHPSFCDECLSAIHSDAQDASLYQSRINAGYHNMQADNAADAKRLRANIRRNLNPNTLDVKPQRKPRT